MKKIITVVIVVALILAAFNILSAPQVKAQTSEAKVLSYSWYVAPADTTQAEYIGDLVAVGEVQNVGSNVLGYVLVNGFAYNSSGAIVDTASAPLFVVDMLPGQKAPFYLDFTPENSVTQDQSWVPSVTNVTVAVSYVNDTTQTMYSGLTIPTGSISASDSSGTYTVSGNVENTGDQTTGYVWVVATFYNASGTVVALNYTDYLDSSTNTLASGNSVPFTATPMDNTAQLSSEIANYSLLVQSAPPIPTTSPSSTSSPGPSSSPGVSTQPTKSPTLLASGLTYGVAGAIAVVVIVLAALMLLRKRHKNAQFEPPPPPPPPPPP